MAECFRRRCKRASEAAWSRQRLLTMVPRELLDRVLADVRRYCEGKGHREGPGVNNFVPHDCVAAFAMARLLVGTGEFDHYVAVAPEGHIYGYFLELLGAAV